jgi:hypothetical protein
MRRNSVRRRTIRAALIALAAGGLVAAGNPAPRVAHDAEVAMASAGHLAQQGVVAVTMRLRG